MAAMRDGGELDEEVIVLSSDEEENKTSNELEKGRVSAPCAQQVACSNSLEEEELYSHITWKDISISPNKEIDTKVPVPIALIENTAYHSPCIPNGISPEPVMDKPLQENVTDSKVAVFPKALQDRVTCNEDDEMKLQSEHAIESFFTVCRAFLDGEDGHKILARVKKLYLSADPGFVYSQQFCDFINTKSKDVLKASNVYIHIKEVCDQLKYHKQKKKSSEVAVQSTTNGLTSCERTSNISASNDFSLPNHRLCSSETSASSVHSRRQPTEKQISRLEDLLKKIDRKIRHLQKKEMTLENLDDSESIYILEDRFKKRFVKVWNKLCELTGQSSCTGREVEKKFRFNGSRYPEVNEKISKFVNKNNLFPDYVDVLTVVSSLNSTLKLPETQLHAVAREVFEEVGKILKMRRWKDNVELMGCSLTDSIDSSNDPAESNEDLKLALQENYRKASKELDQIIDKYAQKQLELKLEPEDVKDDDKTENSSDEENDDEHESEESDVEHIERTVVSDDDDDTVATKENKEEECVQEFPSPNETLPSVSSPALGNHRQERLSSSSLNSSALSPLPKLDLPCTSSSVPSVPAVSSATKRSSLFDFMPSQPKTSRLENCCLSDFTNIKTFQETDDDVIILE